MDNARLSEAAREAALNRLMSTYGTNVLRVCFLYLHDHALAQDAAQTTFLKAWQALDTLRSSETEKAWLMQAGGNTSVSEIISTYVYKTGLQSAQYSFATAVGLFNSVVNLIVLLVVNRIAKKRSEVSLF